MNCLDNIEVITINTYRSGTQVNQSNDRARIVLDLQFPRDLALFKKLKSQMGERNRGLK